MQSSASSNTSMSVLPPVKCHARDNKFSSASELVHMVSLAVQPKVPRRLARLHWLLCPLNADVFHNTCGRRAWSTHAIQSAELSQRHHSLGSVWLRSARTRARPRRMRWLPRSRRAQRCRCRWRGRPRSRTWTACTSRSAWCWRPRSCSAPRCRSPVRPPSDCCRAVLHVVQGSVATSLCAAAHAQL